VLMLRFWAEDKITYESDFIKLTDASVAVKPSRPELPLWIGSRAEAGLRRTGYLGTGWLPTQMLPDEIRAGIKRINEYATEARRAIPDDHFGLQVSSYVVENGKVPDYIKEKYLLQRRTDATPEQINLIGTPDEIIERMKKYIDAGATKFVFNPACGPDELFEQLELQGRLIVQPFHKKLIPLD
jgi:alkanesulfonate monooxygenase SsuD/methylene tetrahydromethanopterin reductase-like flavin-dependent oxidoreductase (luciferase family)